jgi:hypothetical protein
LAKPAFQLWSNQLRQASHLHRNVCLAVGGSAQSERFCAKRGWGWQLSGVIRLQTGGYNSIVGTTSTGTRRADYVGGPVLVANPNPNRWINPAAFAIAPTGRYGDAGTAIVEGPNLQSYDISLAKHFVFRERFDLKLQGDFFNLFNITNFQNLSGNSLQVGTSAFGTISSTYPPRNVQLSLKLAF